jgi:hypothetical protein
MWTLVSAAEELSMTSSIRALLAQIATFEAQSKAGLTPLPGEMIEFFETARIARVDVRAFDTGLVPPSEDQAMPPRAPVAFEQLEGGVVELTARVPLPSMARAVLDELGRHAIGKRIVIGAAGSE